MGNILDDQQKQEKQNTQNQQPGQQKKPFRRPYYRRNYNQNKKPSGQTLSLPHHQQQVIVQHVSFKKVSIIVPLFNEEESLRPLYQEIKKALKTVSCDYEILFIDDGSRDKSLAVIKDIARTDNKVHYYSFRTNYGKSAALQVGFKHVTGDAVITMDADLQDDPAEILNLLKKLEEGYDLVSGWKKKRFDPFIKTITSKFFNFVTRLMSGIKIHDFNCGLKAYRRAVVQSVDVYGEMHRYIPVLAGWKGFSVSEIVVKHHPRRYGKTKFGISRFFKGFIDLITVSFTVRFIKRPMHLFGFVGMLSTFAGIIISLWLTIEKLAFGIGINNRPVFFLGILLIIVGVQFFAIGLIGELMVHNTQSEKEYVIKEKK
ncbi:MAG: glycosyl transferase family 2 [Ignavibacteria bacterium]|nr:MAG: glycosyl transferase family 2 [Ignavibacteria bacterium]KAF0161660.1 MAG: glycosyl transferase family 2 [Ignavibacteria bacterium]